MGNPIQVRTAIEEYLKQAFSGAKITPVEDEESYSFSVQLADQSYFLRVMHSSVEGLSAADINNLLSQFSVSQTMLSLGEFPVVVTESGCMFGSP